MVTPSHSIRPKNISVTAEGDKRGSRRKKGTWQVPWEACTVKVMGVSAAGVRGRTGRFPRPRWGGAEGGFGVGTALCNYRDLEGEKYKRGRRDIWGGDV